MPYIPVGVQSIPLEVVDETTRQGSKLVATEVHVFTRHDDGLTYGLIQATGRMIAGTTEELVAQHRAQESWIDDDAKLTDLTPFECSAPQLTFDFLDQSGFLLEQVSVHLDLQVPVVDDGRIPGRVAQWRIDEDFSPDDFSEPAAKVIMRIEDTSWS
ncbi:hypothetical protein QM806_38615 [Rhodococcus sp. IEGM 1351]|uniref:hypothetical protein n=1 Tax=Rhodococcus sp. IEGM 1351 TaxID=3047089 RepID=UPI0024B71F1E|nr:hypothetical protein [Rhodococcus sp. IEGM 1351]MDI9941265.1 hypothetical protein [Rhodococcus sp. IEGM 1351]